LANVAEGQVGAGDDVAPLAITTSKDVLADLDSLQAEVEALRLQGQ